MASLGLADFGDAARMGGPPKTILTPPPPPAPPPPATRRAQGIASPRTPLDGGLDRPPAPTRAPPSTRPPVGMSAPVVPQHRNDMLQKMLKGLEDDSLTVADVLGVLETELRSGAPTAAPLSEQFERYLGPLTEFSGPAPGPGPGNRGPDAMPRGPSPVPGPTALMGPAPTGLAVPSLGAGYPRSASPAAGGAGNGGQVGPQHVMGNNNCARCNVLDQQVKALAQSLSGLGARMFNWSLAHCRENTERNGLWHLVLKYLQPVSTVDARIAETCTGLQAAVGTSVADPTPGPPVRNKRGGAQNSGNRRAVADPLGNGNASQVWQPPGGGFDSTVARGRAPRFAESMGHMAAAPESLAASRDHSPLHSPPDKEAAPRSRISPSSSSTLKQVDRQDAFVEKRIAQITEVESGLADAQKAPTRIQHAVPDPQHMRAMPVLPYSPPPPIQPPISESQVASAQAYNEVSVRFGASQLSKKLNGIYEKVVGATCNKRPLFNCGQKYLLYLSDGTWAIKDGPEADLDADVYAYVKDDAAEPYNVQCSWQVPADGDGFVPDSKGAVTPGRSDHAEAVAAKAARRQLQTLGAGKQPGAKAEAAMDKRDATERWQKEAKEKGAPRIRVTIVSAAGLESADVFGKSDPFVICKVPRKEMAKFQTPAMQNTANPRWDHEQEVIGWEIGDQLQFCVYDKDTGSASDLLGVADLKTEDFWPDGCDDQLTLLGTPPGVISTLRVRVLVLEKGKPKARNASPERSVAREAVPRAAPAIERPTAAEPKADDHSEIDEYEEEWEDEWGEQEAFAERARQAQRDVEEAAPEDPEDYPHMTEEEVHTYRSQFEKIDVDGDGKINIKELQCKVDVLGVQVTPQEIREFFTHVDADNSGDLDFDEFLDLLDDIRDLEVIKLKEVFAEFDKAGDGVVDMDDLLAVFQEAAEGLSESRIRGMMRDADSSSDATLDFHEFLHLMRTIRQDATKESLESQKQHGNTKTTLAPSERKRIKAYLKRKGFNPEDVNCQRKVGGGFSKKVFEAPLHTAASENLCDMVWLLLQSQADPNAKNSLGQTPMDIAEKADKKGSHKAVKQHLEQAQQDREAALLDVADDGCEVF